MSILGFEAAKAYQKGDFQGWLGTNNPELVKSQFDLFVTQGLIKPTFNLVGQTRATSGTKMMLYQVCRKVLGQDTENYPQEIGDCVSFGAKNAGEYVTCTQILLQGLREKFRSIFPPYYYGTGRTYEGRGQIPDRSDGSMGSWMAAAVQKYGTLFSDEPNVPNYSGSIAKSWGNRNSRDDLDLWLPKAKNFLIKSASLISSWDDLVAAIKNGYPCTTASDIGYNMEVSRDGFHRQTTSWSHQMCFIGVDDNDKDPYAIILNNWGDVHGNLKDFVDGHDLPIGVLRVRRADALKHIRAGETFAYHNFDAAKEQDLDKALFDLF